MDLILPGTVLFPNPFLFHLSLDYASVLYYCPDVELAKLFISAENLINGKLSLFEVRSTIDKIFYYNAMLNILNAYQAANILFLKNKKTEALGLLKVISRVELYVNHDHHHLLMYTTTSQVLFTLTLVVPNRGVHLLS